MSVGEYVVLWDNPYGVQRQEQEWFESLDEAEAAINRWRSEFPWNTYALAKVVAIHAATAKRPNPHARLSPG